MQDANLEECLAAGGSRQEEEGRIRFSPVVVLKIIRTELI